MNTTSHTPAGSLQGSALLRVDPGHLSHPAVLSDQPVDGTRSSPVFGECLTLRYYSRPVRALMIDGVPWFVLRDMVDALGWDYWTLKAAESEGVPSFVMRPAYEAMGDDIHGPADVALRLISPVGVLYWTNSVDGHKGQAITAWAKREAARLCPKPTSRDRAMTLTLLKGPDGRRYRPPCPVRYSGWSNDWNMLRWSPEGSKASKWEDCKPADYSRMRPCRPLERSTLH